MLFVCSDIHGDHAALKQTLAAFKRSGASHFVCLGDILNHGPRNPIPEHYAPLAVAEDLNKIADKIIAVRGNCDSEVDQALCQFPMLGEYNQLLLGDRKVFLCHGHTYSPTKLPPLAMGDLFVSGHSHIPVAKMQEGHFVLNPGSVSIPRQEWQASYALIRAQEIKVCRLSDDEVLLSCDLD